MDGMNNMRAILLLCVVILAGCPPTPDTIHTAPPSSIEHMTTLPPVTSVTHVGKIELTVFFYVLKNGTVEEVRLMTSSGDPTWDSAVVDSLKRWRFAPVADESPSESRWIRYTIHVEIVEPILMNLGEIIALNRQEADSLYTLLTEGMDFSRIASEIREGTNEQLGKLLGTTNIMQYPDYIRAELVKLRVCRFTRPIERGDKFVIYKRFRD